MYNRCKRSPRQVPRAWLWLLVMVGWASLDISAQSTRPQFRKWNVGLVEGVGPLNANSALPTVSGHLRNWSVELSPYAFNLGMGVNYHFPVLTVLKKIRFTIDGMAFYARQNANYFVTDPWVLRMRNVHRTGLMGGSSLYFLRRFSAQFLLGLEYVRHYGPEELRSSYDQRSYIIESGAISLQCRLFNTFQQ